MADPRVDKILEALTGQTELGKQLGALDIWNANGNSLLVGYANEQAKLAAHVNVHPGGAPLAPGTQFTVEVL